MANGKVFVPGNGFAGFAQQTVAVQSLLRRKRPATKKRRKVAAKKRPAKRTAKPRAQGVGAKAARRTKGRLVKGSPAAKRRMAAIRRMRK